MSTLRTIYNYVKYPHKNKYSMIIIQLSKLLRESNIVNHNNNDKNIIGQENNKERVDSQLIDLAVCTENVSLAIYLHSSLSNFKNIIQDQNFFVGKILEKSLSNKRLVLSGDFFHVKASSLSAKIGYLEIPQNFSKIEENVSKGMIMQETLNKRVLKNEPIEQYDVENMIKLRDTSLISYSLKCLGVIVRLNEQQQEELYEIGVTIGKIIHLKHTLLMNQKIPQSLKILELINLKIKHTNPEYIQTYQNEVEVQKTKLIEQLKSQLQKFKIEEHKINEFVKAI